MSRHCRTACTSMAGDCSAHAPPRVSRACSPRVVTTAHVVVCPSGRAHGRTAGTRPPVGRGSVKSAMTVTSNDQQNGKISFKSVVTRVRIERCNIQDHSIIFFEKQNFSRTFPLDTHSGIYNERDAVTSQLSMQM